MKNRMYYLLAFFAVLVVEICIGLFVRDCFVRPYVGDMLVTVLLCYLCRAVWPKFHPAVAVFLFATVVEALQWLRLTEILGLQDTVLSVILGATFDWKDVLCYALGCILFTITERLAAKIRT